jgi:hypothetical protein
MKHLKTYEKLSQHRSKIPNLDIVDPEFWKMVKIVDWKSVIEGYEKNIPHNEKRDFYKDAQKRLCSNYEFEQIKKLEIECHKIYTQVYNYFESIWLDDKYSKIMPSDDGYTDLISSMVGLGKKFIQKCIDNDYYFIKMAKDDFYVENFTYLFYVDYKEYSEIRAEADPLWGAAQKYNL